MPALDPELAAIRKICRILDSLPAPDRARVIDYAARRVNVAELSNAPLYPTPLVPTGNVSYGVGQTNSR